MGHRDQGAGHGSPQHRRRRRSGLGLVRQHRQVRGRRPLQKRLRRVSGVRDSTLSRAHPRRSRAGEEFEGARAAHSPRRDPLIDRQRASTCRETLSIRQRYGTNRTQTQPLGLATSCFSGASPRRHRMSRRSRFPTEHRSGAGSLYREKHGFRAAVRARMVGVREKLGQLRRPRGRPLTPRLQAFSGRRDRSRLWA